MRRALVMLGFLCLTCGSAFAAADSIPPQLKEWQGWVLHGHEQRTCPILSTQSGANDDNYQCAWPGRLRVVADAKGARFDLAVHVDAESWIALPGGHDAWPQQVQLGNTPAVVVEHDGAPSLHLDAGDYVIAGNFAWDERPARLQVPSAIAMVALSVDGKNIAQPERNDDLLTLGEAAPSRREADALGLRVFRRLADGAPPMLETQIQLHVAGSAREQLLGPALPQGFVATALGGDLPARLESDGHLRVQLRPGDWSLTLSARETTPPGKLSLNSPPAPWPQQEIWSYSDAPALRTTRASGSQPIDPAQANVPLDWQNLPAFVMDNGSTLAVEQSARGRDSNAGDHLQLTRQLWLDFEGVGLTADDHLTGKLVSSDRLDVAAPWRLERAALHDENPPDAQPLLVTRGAKPDSSGVELRTRDLDLHAGLRRETHAGAQSATGGWQDTLDGVDATLHLPYGYRLLGAPGADRSPDSWVAQWNLLDLFVAAVIVLLSWRLLGWPWAIAALGFVVLSQTEPGAPRWLPFIAVALALIARALPPGRLRAFSRYAGMAALALAVLITLPFGAEQLRDALHPQLENQHFAGNLLADQFASPEANNSVREAVLPPPPPPPAAPPPVQEVSSMPAPAAPPILAKVKQPQTLQTIVVTGSKITAMDLANAESYPSSAIVQSGRGVPDWSGIGSSYRLGWSGPVTAQQTWRLVILPGWTTRLLRVLMLGLLVAWLAAIARALDLPTRLPRWPRHATTAALLLLAFIPLARAQDTPSPELLSQLRYRLLEVPHCAPQCAASPSAQISLQQDTLQVSIEADADAPVAFPLPHMDAPSTLSGVTLDGKPAPALARRDDGVWVSLDRGVHRIGLDFTLRSDAENGVLHFPLPPPRVQVVAPGWQVSGADGTRLLSDTLSFARERASTKADNAIAAAQAFPPYVQLTRSIAIGIDSFIFNQVHRVAPSEGGFSISLPLLPGEHVSDARLKAGHGRVQITFAPGQNDASWQSSLDFKNTITLHAPSFGEGAEIWQIGSAPLMHLSFSGVPETVSEGDADAEGMHEFRPLPGEALSVRITRPAALPGNSIAFDRVTLDATRGDRALETSLTLVARSTRGGEQVIDLPRGAQLLGVQRDGDSLELNLRDGHLGLPVQPGVQTFSLRFRDDSSLGMVSGTPSVALHAHAANIQSSLSLPQDRWVLWTWGPAAGPAVLYWSELIALLVVALMLAQFAPTPLRWWQWLLLGLGFSTFAWSAYALVAVWLIALGLRARSERLPGYAAFNLVQAALAVLTAIALLCLVSAVPQGLLGQPDMRIAGNDSSAWLLHWFADQSGNSLPHAGAFSLPLWTYKLAMLVWALWLANALIGWLRWGFEAWTRGGYWKSDRPAAPPPAPAPSDS